MLESFRKRRQLTGLYVGIDIHGKCSQVCVMDEAGQVVDKTRLDHGDPRGITDFFERVPAGTPVVMEATCGWMWLSDHLELLGMEVHLAHMAAVRLIAESRLKNDKVDARILAHLLRTGFLPEAYYAPEAVRDIRLLLRYRQGLIKDRTMMKNRVHALLMRYNVHPPQSDIFGMQGTLLLRALELPPPARRVLDGLLDGIAFYNEKVQQLERHLRREPAGDDRVEWLASLPGVGRLTAWFLISEIGRIDRFATAKKLISYAGLCPSARSSAGQERHGTTQGSGRRLLKWSLVEAAHTAVKRDAYFATIFHRIERRKEKQKAYVAVARHLAKIIRQMLQEKRASRPRRKHSQAGSSRPMAVCR